MLFRSLPVILLVLVTKQLGIDSVTVTKNTAFDMSLSMPKTPLKVIFRVVDKNRNTKEHKREDLQSAIFTDESFQVFSHLPVDADLFFLSTQRFLTPEKWVRYNVSLRKNLNFVVETFSEAVFVLKSVQKLLFNFYLVPLPLRKRNPIFNLFFTLSLKNVDLLCDEIVQDPSQLVVDDAFVLSANRKMRFFKLKTNKHTFRFVECSFVYFGCSYVARLLQRLSI